MGARDIYERDEVINIINSVIEKVGQKETVSRDQIASELQHLQGIIRSARAEIADISPRDINDTFVPTATDELDAVIVSMEEATSRIMDGCDAIQGELPGVAGDAGPKIEQHLMGIYEACSFQDLSGQRITKVVKSLKLIEQKVGALLDVLGATIASAGDGTASRHFTSGDGLLNGPALPKNNVAQDDIDRLLAEFDKP